jgi:hypothetical protein
MAVKCIQLLDYKIVYGPSSHPANFTTYSDSDYADTAKSTSGFVLLMGGREMAFFRYVFQDMGYLVSLPRPLAMENQSAIGCQES